MKLTPQEIKNAIQEHEAKIAQLQEELKKSSYVTGFERVKGGEKFSCVCSDGKKIKISDIGYESDDLYFEIANYGSEKRMSLLEKMNRLQRLLYRFSCENGGDKIDWSDFQEKWFISYDVPAKEYVIYNCIFLKHANVIYFISEEVAEQALEKFQPLIEEIIKEEQEVKEYYLGLNPKEKLTRTRKFPVGRVFIVNRNIYEILNIDKDDENILYDICLKNSRSGEVLNVTESELEQIILRGSFDE